MRGGRDEAPVRRCTRAVAGSVTAALASLWRVLLVVRAGCGVSCRRLAWGGAGLGSSERVLGQGLRLKCHWVRTPAGVETGGVAPKPCKLPTQPDKLTPLRSSFCFPHLFQLLLPFLVRLLLLLLLICPQCAWQRPVVHVVLQAVGPGYGLPTCAGGSGTCGSD